MKAIAADLLIFFSSLIQQLTTLITGGVVIALLTLYQWKTGKNIPKRIYAWLFAVFMFWSVFSAWRGEHFNSAKLIEQKAELSSSVSDCRAHSLQYEAILQSRSEMILSLQRSLEAERAPQLQQQANIGTCIVELAKLNPAARRRIIVVTDRFAEVDPQGGAHPTPGGKPAWRSLFVILLLTNEPEPKVDGVLECANDFSVEDLPKLPPNYGGSQINLTGRPAQLAPNKYHLAVVQTGSEWNESSPVSMVVSSASDQLGKCSFEPAERY